MSRLCLPPVCFCLTCEDCRPKRAGSIRTVGFYFCSPECALRFFEKKVSAKLWSRFGLPLSFPYRVCHACTGGEFCERFLPVRAPHDSVLHRYNAPGLYCSRACLLEVLHRERQDFERAGLLAWYERP